MDYREISPAGLFRFIFPSILKSTLMRRDTQLVLEVKAINHQFEVASGTTKPTRKAKFRG